MNGKDPRGRWAETGFGVAVGCAGILGTAVAVLTYCSSRGDKSRAGPPTATPPPRPRPKLLPVDAAWRNASGPKTFALASSAAVILPAQTNRADLHIRFTLRSTAAAPVQVWLLTEDGDYFSNIKGWVVDTARTKCVPLNSFVTVLALAKDGEILVEDDSVKEQPVQVSAPTLASNGALSFTIGYDCEKPVTSSQVMFASARIVVGYRGVRRAIYFQNDSLPIYVD